MRLSYLRVASLLLPAAVAVAGPACGGKTVPGTGVGTSSGSGGGGSGSSGGSIASCGAGSSSGGTSTGGTSSGGSSSGGEEVCPADIPTGRCSIEDQNCSYCEQGVGIDCACSAGEWLCVGTEQLCTLPACPPGAPQPGTGCGPVQYTCSWGTMEGCGGETCTCDSGAWACEAANCPPPPPCPPEPPQPMSICESVGQTCSYLPPPGCDASEECECNPSGTWGCTPGGCAADAGSSKADAQ